MCCEIVIILIGLNFFEKMLLDLSVIWIKFNLYELNVC